MSIFREQDFLRPSEVTTDKILEICQNAYLYAYISNESKPSRVFVKENDVLVQIICYNDFIKMVFWIGFHVSEDGNQEEIQNRSLLMAIATCNNINKDWAMLKTHATITDGQLYIEASHETYYDRGLFIPQFVSNIRRLCGAYKSAQQHFFTLAEKL